MQQLLKFLAASIGSRLRTFCLDEPEGMDKLKNLHDMESIKAAVDEFLQKENSAMDRYDLFTKKIWLTVGKPEPQAQEFAHCLKSLADSFTGQNWKVLYKLR